MGCHTLSMRGPGVPPPGTCSPLLPDPRLARAPWPRPRSQGKWAATVVLLPLLLPGDKIFAESRVWYSRGPSPLAFLPHPYLLGTPTLPGVVGEGLVFHIQRQTIRCLDSESHFLNILMEYKDHRTGQEVPTWKVT